MAACVYLIPTVLAEGRNETIPGYVTEAVKECSVFFVEQERTARRFFKSIWKEMPIDDLQWHNMKDVDPQTESAFREAIRKGSTIGIISEAGCPGIADPGQKLVSIAQDMRARVRPLVGPSSILLALMASGMNGQQFEFLGYLPIDATEKAKTIRQLENNSRIRNSTQIFIETPYRNNQLTEVLIKTLQPSTRLCIAVNLTAPDESVITRTIGDWKKQLPSFPKQPAIFLLYAGQ